MKFTQEFRDPETVNRLVDQIHRTVTRPWVIMEICGGQTHAIMRYGLDQLLPPEIELVHGPGCPVCVTSLELIDKALARTGGNRTHAAKMLEISHRALLYKLKEYGIE